MGTECGGYDNIRWRQYKGNSYAFHITEPRSIHCTNRKFGERTNAGQHHSTTAPTRTTNDTMPKEEIRIFTKFPPESETIVWNKQNSFSNAVLRTSDCESRSLRMYGKAWSLPTDKANTTSTFRNRKTRSENRQNVRIGRISKTKSCWARWGNLLAVQLEKHNLPNTGVTLDIDTPPCPATWSPPEPCGSAATTHTRTRRPQCSEDLLNRRTVWWFQTLCGPLECVGQRGLRMNFFNRRKLHECEGPIWSQSPWEWGECVLMQSDVCQQTASYKSLDKYGLETPHPEMGLVNLHLKGTQYLFSRAIYDVVSSFLQVGGFLQYAPCLTPRICCSILNTLPLFTGYYVCVNTIYPGYKSWYALLNEQFKLLWIFEDHISSRFNKITMCVHKGFVGDFLPLVVRRLKTLNALLRYDQCIADPWSLTSRQFKEPLASETLQ